MPMCARHTMNYVALAEPNKARAQGVLAALDTEVAMAAVAA